MKEIINQFDHLCSIKEYSSYEGMQVLHDGTAFLYVVKIEESEDSEVTVKIPLLKYHEVDPRQIVAEIQEELVRKFIAPSVYDQGFDEFIQELVEDHGKSRIFHPFYLSMPHNPNMDFFEDTEYLCSVMFCDKEQIKFNVSQIDVNLFGSLPYNLLYSVVFAMILANMTGCKLVECNFDFVNSYLRREDLPRVGQLLENTPELDVCKISIKKPVESLRTFDLKNIEIKIL